jgi:RHS repeat-associated protein
MRSTACIRSLFLIALMTLAGLPSGQTGSGGYAPAAEAHLGKTVPTALRWLGAPDERPGDLWSLFDGNTERGLRFPSGAPGELRLELDGSREIAALGTFGAADGRLSVAAERDGAWVPLADLDLRPLSPRDWHRFAVEAAVTTRALLLTWQPFAAGTHLPELELWSADPPGENANPADDDTTRLVAASPQTRQIRQIGATAADAGTFRFQLERAPVAFTRAFLVYDLVGLPPGSAARRSLNGLPPQEGPAVAEAPGESQEIEEINPRWLRRGANEVRFLPVPRGETLPRGLTNLRPRAAANAAGETVPYTVRNLRLALVEDGGRPLVREPAAFSPGPSALAAALVDGDLATGWSGSDDPESPRPRSVDLPLERPSQPYAIEIATVGRPAGNLTLEAVPREGGAVALRAPLALGSLVPGRHRLMLDEGLPPATAIRLTWEAAAGPNPGRGRIAEIDLLASPVGGRQREPRLRLTQPLRGEAADPGAVLRGFVEPAADGIGPAELFVDGVHVAQGIAPEDGAWSVFVPRPGNAVSAASAWNVALEVVYPGGARLRHTVRLGGAPEGGGGPDGKSAELEARPGESRSLGLGRARLDVPKDAVTKKMALSMRALSRAELPALDAGMTNVTAPEAGFRMGPHGARFAKPLRLTLPYDPARIPPGMTPDDVRTYYFDEEAGRWFPVPRLAVEAGSNMVVSATDHFTDFINATLALPDEPAAANWNPNSVRELAKADPGAEITLIEPPEGGPSGDAELSFPLVVPPGRRGLAPELAVRYRSGKGGGADGWLGLGWDLELPSVSVSTLFGVPPYAPDRESESYLLNGDPLAPRADPQASRQADRIFTRRVEGSFERIVRKGDRPDGYWWEVTDKSGTRFRYGVTPQARLHDYQAPANTFRWYLEEVVDLHGNTVHYTYRPDQPNPQAGGEPWTQLYPAQIDYTGAGGAGGAGAGYYQVRFFLDDGSRPDKLSSGLPGFKVYTRYRLDHADVLAGGALVRRYLFQYREGDFGKSLLAAIAVTGEDGESELYRHSFDYAQMPRKDGGFDGFDSQAAWGQMGSGDDATSDESLAGGAHAFAGLGPPNDCQPAHAGVQTGGGGGGTTTGTAFLDVDGDGLPDRIAQDGTVELNHYDPALDSGGFSRSSFPGTAALGHTAEWSFDLGGAGHAFAEQLTLGANWVWSHSNDDRALLDVNGDGLPDLVSTAGGFAIQENDGTAFRDPSDWSGFSQSGLDLSIPRERQDVLGSFKRSDTLRKLALPYTGTVIVDGAVQKEQAGGDGVKVAIYRNLTRVWQHTIVASDTSSCVPGAGDSCGGGLTLAVTAGDRLYFLADSIQDTAADDLLWAPRVTYTGHSAAELAASEPWGAPLFVFDGAADFRLAGFAGSGWAAPAKGTVRVTGRLVKQATADAVVASIVRQRAGAADLTVYTKSLAAADTGSFDDVPPIDVEAGDGLLFRIAADSPIDPDGAVWTPTVTYEGGQLCRAAGGSEVCGSLSCSPDPSGTVFCALSGDPTGPPIREDVVTQPAQVASAVPLLLPRDRPTVSWSAPSAGDYTFDLFWSGSGPALIYVQGGNRLIAKHAVPAEGISFSVTAHAAAGERLTFTVLTDRASAVGILNARLGGAAVPVGVPVNLRFRADSGDVLSGGYHGWFYGEWNGEVPFSETGLAAEPKDQQKDFIPAVPRWQGVTGLAEPAWRAAGFDLHFVKEGVKPSRQGGNAAAGLGQANGGGGGGPDLIRKTYGNTAAVEASLGLGFALATGTTDTQLDLLDMNGDRYPDEVMEGAVRFSDGHGGFGPSISIPRFSDSLRHAADGNFSTNIGVGVNFTKKDGQGNAKAVVSTMPSVGATTALSQGRTDLVDVNGDGLPDRLSMSPGDADLTVQLNLGYRFGAPERWPLPNWETGVSARCREAVDFDNEAVLGFLSDLGLDLDTFDSLSLTESSAVNAGFAFGPIGGGASTTLSRTLVELVDVNGDGLPDHVAKDEGNAFFRVKLNRGDGWGPEERWSVPAWSTGLGDGYNPLGIFRCLDAIRLSGVVDGTGSAGAPICIPLIPPRPVVGLQLEVSAQFEGGKGGTQLSFEDLDGDGLPDPVLKKAGDPSVYVKRNKAGKVNLLTAVHRPLGGTIALEYRRQGNRVDRANAAHKIDMPESQWVLATTTVDDGRGHSYTTRFDYGNDAFYDRGERESYGYAQVRTTLPDGTVVQRAFHNQDYSTKGLLATEVIADAAGNLFRQETATYDLRPVGPDAFFPAKIQQATLYYEGTTASPDAFQKATAATFDYDPLGTVTRIVDLGDDGAADDLAVTAAYQVDPTSYLVVPSRLEVRDGAGRLLRQRQASYDALGDLLRLEETLVGGVDPATGVPYTGANNAVSIYTWDAAGNLASATDPTGFTTTYTYDPVVQTYPVATRDSFGYTTSASYDLKHGAPTQVVDKNGNAVTRTYDAFGRLTQVFGPDDGPGGPGAPTLAFDYAPAALPAWAVVHHKDVTRSDPIDSALFVDGLGRTVETKEDAELDLGSGTSTRVGMRVSGRVEWDAKGRIAAIGQPAFDDGPANRFVDLPLTHPTLFSYDALDRTRKVYFPHGAETRVDYGFGALDGTTRLATSRTDGNGRLTRFYNDVRGNVLGVAQSNRIGGATRQLLTRYSYDALSELATVADAKGNVTRLEYDTLGRRTAIASPDSGRTELRWDRGGNLGARIPANLAARGQQIRYRSTFDRLDRIDYPSLPPVLYTYGGPGAPANRADRVATVTDASGVEERSYGKLGDVVQTVKTATAVNGPSPRGPFITSFRFDGLGRLLSMVYPDGEELSYTYDAGGQVKAAAGVLQGVRSVYLAHAGYDEFGERVRTVYGNGVETRASYDPLSRFLAQLKTAGPAGGTFQNLRYDRDPVGTLRALANDVAVPAPALYGGPTSQSFGYDDLYQLTSAQGIYRSAPNKTSTYSLSLDYDEIGNTLAKRQLHQVASGGGPAIVQKKTSYETAYLYRGTQPHAATHIGDRTYHYDLDGNQTGWDQDTNGTRTTRVWDEEDRLAASADNGQTTRFLYDAAGVRTNKQGPNGETIYVNPYFSLKNGAIASKHVYADDVRLATRIAQPAGVPGAQPLYFYHGDHLGSSNFVTDAAGALYQHLEYFPSGELWVDERTETQRTPFLFSAKEVDEETGLTYFGARYYEPRQGQWVSADPILDKMLDAEALAEPDLSTEPFRLPGQIYAYVANSPTNLVDPTGLWPPPGFGFTSFSRFARFAPEAANLHGSLFFTSFRLYSTLLEKRAQELHRLLPKVTQDKTTTALTATKEGVTIVSSSEKRLRKVVRDALKKSEKIEIEAIGEGHAEETGVSFAKKNGYTPTETAASRPICNNCAKFLEKEGVQPASPLKTKKPEQKKTSG